MFSPITTTLIKIFVKGFYKVHSGLLLFLFNAFIINFFFTEILNQTHISPENRFEFNLKLVLTFVSSPIMMGLVFMGWILFTIKSWSYVSAQFALPSNRFLFYSITASAKSRQFMSWFTVQFIISLPIVCYGVFSLAIGIYLGYYFSSLVILVFVVGLCLVSATYYVLLLNTPENTGNITVFLEFITSIKKPFFALFIFQLLYQEKTMLLITKAIALGILCSGAILLRSDPDSIIIGGLIMLGVLTSHAVLIYHSFLFELTKLPFLGNMPYSKTKVLIDQMALWLVLFLPECFWLIFNFQLTSILALLVLCVSSALFFKYLLHYLQGAMRRYIYWIFFLMIFYVLMVQSGWMGILILINVMGIWLCLRYSRIKENGLLY